MFFSFNLIMSLIWIFSEAAQILDSEQENNLESNPSIVNYGTGTVVVTTTATNTANSKVGKYSGASHSDAFPTANVGEQFSPQFIGSLLETMASNGGGEIELGGDVVNQKSEAATYAIGHLNRKTPTNSASKAATFDD